MAGRFPWKGLFGGAFAGAILRLLLLGAFAVPLAAQPLQVGGELGSTELPAARRLLLIVDIHADPFGTGGTPGALFLANPRTGKVVPVASDPNWECPVAVVSRDKVWLVLDLCKSAVLRVPRPSADQPGLINSAVLFSSPLVAPIAWFELPSGERLIADGYADPLGLGFDGVGLGYSTFGRGAIYRVDLRTGALTVALASPMFVNPTQMVWLDQQEVKRLGLATR